MKRLAVFGALLVGATLLAATRPSVAEPTGEKQPHRLYDDRGTLDWRSKLAAVQKIAKERRRLIFVEFGRES